MIADHAFLPTVAAAEEPLWLIFWGLVAACVMLGIIMAKFTRIAEALERIASVLEQDTTSPARDARKE